MLLVTILLKFWLTIYSLPMCAVSKLIYKQLRPSLKRRNASILQQRYGYVHWLTESANGRIPEPCGSKVSCFDLGQPVGRASWSSGNTFVSGAGGLSYKFQTGQIEHSVANGSPLLRHSFERSCVSRAQWRWNGRLKHVTCLGVIQRV